MIGFYSENQEPQQFTIIKILSFSKSIKFVKSTILHEDYIINLN